MTDSDQKFWPYKPRLTLAATAAILVGLVLATAVLRALAKWPSEKSDTVVIIGILLLSLLPLALAVLDVIIDRGGRIKYGAVEFDFARSKEKGIAGITVASNIGVPGQPVSDSATMQILETWKQATANDIVVVDLEDGHAWWETRLLVLLAGAVRLGKPDKVVFLGKDAGSTANSSGGLMRTSYCRVLSLLTHNMREVFTRPGRPRGSGRSSNLLIRPIRQT
jgi:hypothetical protein